VSGRDFKPRRKQALCNRARFQSCRKRKLKGSEPALAGDTRSCFAFFSSLFSLPQNGSNKTGALASGKMLFCRG
jgi:hypothetical protein